MAPIKILTSQAHSVNLFKNLRTKVMKSCANIYFNQQCLNKYQSHLYLHSVTFVNFWGSQKCALLLDVP